MRNELPAVNQKRCLIEPDRFEPADSKLAEWVLKKNCSLSPRQLIAVFATLALLSICVSAYWALQGAWVVVPFAVLESAALALAFFCYAKHSTDREQVSLGEAALVVERTVGSRVSRVVLPRAWLRVRFDEEETGLVWCQSGSTEVPLGQFVDHEGRRRFFEELRTLLRPAFA